MTDPKPRDLGPDELAAELAGYVPSPWHEWLERQRRKSNGLVDQGDGGAGTWEQDHPPHGTDPPPRVPRPKPRPPSKPLPPAA